MSLPSLHITGQIAGGKNNICITRTGHRFPKKSWVIWRDAAVAEVVRQIPHGWQPLDSPLNVRLDYVAGDRRRRDFPAICDAIWHVLERAGIVTDDTLLWPAESTRSYDKKTPGVTITFLTP